MSQVLTIKALVSGEVVPEAESGTFLCATTMGPMTMYYGTDSTGHLVISCLPLNGAPRKD